LEPGDLLIFSCAGYYLMRISALLIFLEKRKEEALVVVQHRNVDIPDQAEGRRPRGQSPKGSACWPIF
jgi:hypothetical protein